MVLRTVATILRETGMKMNAGGLDREFRVVAGLMLIAMGLSGVIGASGWIGMMAVLSGAPGYCPAYSLLGLNTCPMKRIQPAGSSCGFCKGVSLSR